MQPKGGAGKDVSEKISLVMPAFKDIFDEESFYIFAFCLTIAAFFIAFFASRRVSIKDLGHVD